jgi:predicted component of type VI protein secretion system
VLAERLRSDPSVDVRMGCLFVFSRLFVTMGVESLELLAERLKEIHRLLRHASESDADTGVRGRAREVLALMNDITRAVFQRQSPMREDHVLHVVTSPRS